MVSDGLIGEGGGCDRLCWGERNPSPAPKPPKGGGGGSSDGECHGALCSLDERNEQISDECDGSGLITQYCLDMDAKSAQELENFLDDVSTALNWLTWLDYIGATIGVSARLFPNSLPIAVIEALLLVPVPVAVGIFIIGLSANKLSNELNYSVNKVSENFDKIC